MQVFVVVKTVNFSQFKFVNKLNENKNNKYLIKVILKDKYQNRCMPFYYHLKLLFCFHCQVLYESHQWWQFLPNKKSPYWLELLKTLQNTSYSVNCTVFFRFVLLSSDNDLASFLQRCLEEKDRKFGYKKANLLLSKHHWSSTMKLSVGILLLLVLRVESFR